LIFIFSRLGKSKIALIRRLKNQENRWFLQKRSLHNKTGFSKGIN